MKSKLNFYLSAGLIFALAACTSAKSEEENIIEAGAVPQAVLTNFESRFIKGDSLVWSFENEKYEAEFSQYGKRFEATFLANGELTAVKSNMPIQLIPAELTGYINEDYPGATISEAEKVMNNEGNFYEIIIEFKGKEMDLIFDTEGKFVRVVAD